MTLSFDKENYTQFVLGKSESGNWSSIGENLYEFNSTKGYTYEAEIMQISDNQIIFKKQSGEWQLIKSSEKADLVFEENILDKIKGINIDRKTLLGKWYHNGQNINGNENDIILKHSNTELVNYTFLDNGEFINKAPFEIELSANWTIDKDNQTLIIESDELTEFLKVTKLNETELYLYQPISKSVIKFKR
ncbi:MAG: hypothetical protein AAF487_13600 [Bacteroidota bacterium]